MKEKLVELLISKAGINKDQAEKGVDAILEHIKANPSELTAFLEKSGAAGIGEKVKGMFK